VDSRDEQGQQAEAHGQLQDDTNIAGDDRQGLPSVSGSRGAQKISARMPMTTSNPIKKMTPIVPPRNFNMSGPYAFGDAGARQERRQPPRGAGQAGSAFPPGRRVGAPPPSVEHVR